MSAIDVRRSVSNEPSIADTIGQPHEKAETKVRKTFLNCSLCTFNW